MELQTAHVMPSQDNLILNDITKRYGRSSAIISGFNHTFYTGTATGLTGPNGSGKTTLLRLLSVSSFPSEGTILYGPLNVCQSPYAYLQRVGIVHDVASLPLYMTAVELLEYILRTRTEWSNDHQKQIDDLLNILDLDERRHNLIGTYSSGMLKKTQIAAALITTPAILLLDEPFRGLDSQSADTALTLLQQAKAQQAIIVISSHRQDILDKLCDAYVDMGSAASHPA